MCDLGYKYDSHFHVKPNCSTRNDDTVFFSLTPVEVLMNDLSLPPFACSPPPVAWFNLSSHPSIALTLHCVLLPQRLSLFISLTSADFNLSLQPPSLKCFTRIEFSTASVKIVQLYRLTSLLLLELIEFFSTSTTRISKMTTTRDCIIFLVSLIHACNAATHTGRKKKQKQRSCVFQAVKD